MRATALAPEDRFASARELFDDVEHFLDGDRDLERRRELAARAAQSAETAGDKALVDRGELERRKALQMAGRALALDPENACAMRVIVRMLFAPPAQLPAEVERDIERSEAQMVRVASIEGGWTMLAWLLFVPFQLWMGLRDVRPFAVFLALVAGAATVGFLGPRLHLSETVRHFIGFGLACSAIMLASPILGPFVLVPMMAGITTIAFVLYSRPALRLPTLVMGTLTVVLPLIAELLGWVPRTTFFVDDTMVIRSWALHLPQLPTLVALGVTLVAAMVLPALYVLRVRDALSEAEKRLHLQSWHLRQLLPAEAHDALGSPR